MSMENPFGVPNTPPSESEFDKNAKEKGYVDVATKAGVVRENLKPGESVEDAISRAQKIGENLFENKNKGE